MSTINGSKTYMTAIAMGIIALLSVIFNMDIFPEEQSTECIMAFIGLLGAAIRHRMVKQ